MICHSYPLYISKGETLLVDKLAKDLPIFAFIFTSKSQKDGQAVHIKSTWAKRFTKYLFFSDVEDADLPAVSKSSIILT